MMSIFGFLEIYKFKDVNVINGGELWVLFLLGLIIQDFDKIVTIQ